MVSIEQNQVLCNCSIAISHKELYIIEYCVLTIPGATQCTATCKIRRTELSERKASQLPFNAAKLAEQLQTEQLSSKKAARCKLCTSGSTKHDWTAARNDITKLTVECCKEMQQLVA
eukprot:243273-Pelagomonas_calceolata.AAC.12